MLADLKVGQVWQTREHCRAYIQALRPIADETVNVTFRWVATHHETGSGRTRSVPYVATPDHYRYGNNNRPSDDDFMQLLWEPPNGPE